MNYHRACPECGTLVDDDGYCTDIGCRYCGKVPPFTIDRSLVDPVPKGFTLSDGGRQLSWEIPCVMNGQPATARGTVTWDHDPAPEHLQYAIDHALDATRDTLHEVGQGNKIRQLTKRLYLYHAWGPPVWWVPRPILSFRKREVGLGWLTHGFILYWQK